jgi:hypothetical protein
MEVYRDVGGSGTAAMSQRRHEEFVDVLRQGVFSLLRLHHLGQRASRVGRAAGKHDEVEEIYEE